jgi:predicted HTH domain antitoxin
MFLTHKHLHVLSGSQITGCFHEPFTRNIIQNMTSIAIQIPDSILESHHHNLDAVKHEAQQGVVIWEYLNGHVSLREAGTLLGIGYRGFLELLWGKGIPVDALDEGEIQEQMTQVNELLDSA